MDFDLSQALDDSSEIDETEFKCCCFDMKSFLTMRGESSHEGSRSQRRTLGSTERIHNTVQLKDLQDDIFTLDDGLALVVSRNPKTMQCIATLLLAVNRMKRPLTHSNRDISNGELCSAIMESLVEETIVKKTENFSKAVNRIFQRVNSAKMFTLTDTEQKDIVYENAELELKAITLKGGNSDRKVNFKLERYISVNPGKGQTVVLSITNNNMYISCDMKDGKAVLMLEECSEQTLGSISDDGNMDRFLFYRTITEINHTRFESVKCPGWFISTSYEGENQPVEMCEADTDRRLTCFKTN